MEGGSSPISSRKTVPPSAASKAPSRADAAPGDGLAAAAAELAVERKLHHRVGDQHVHREGPEREPLVDEKAAAAGRIAHGLQLIDHRAAGRDW